MTNPRSTPIAVTLAPAGDAGPPVSFSWDAECVKSDYTLTGSLRDERADDPASVARFAPGETKRFVVDFKIDLTRDVFWTLPPCAYVFTGYYNGRFSGPASTPDTVVVGS